MKKKNHVYKVGDRVGLAVSEYDDEYNYDGPTVGKLRYNEDEGPEYGVVTRVVSSGRVFVKWDNEWYNKYHEDEEQETNKLLPEAVHKKEYARLKADYNKLGTEIKAKMKEAAKLVREAGKLASKTNHELSEMYDEVSPLINAMDASGWRSSSWGC